MKILAVTDWNVLHGGAEAYLTWVVDGLRAAGHEARLLTSDAGTAGDGRAEYVARASRSTPMRALTQIHNPAAARTMRRALAEFEPDAVYVSMFALHLSPSILDPLRDVPALLTVSDYKCVCPVSSKLLPDGSRCRDPHGLVCYRQGCTGLLHWLRDRLRYARIEGGLERFDRVVTCSEALAVDLRREGIECEHLVYPVAPPAGESDRTPAATPTFVFVGRLSREKGVDVLLRAFALVLKQEPSATLRVVGDGEEAAALKVLSDELGLGSSVTFTGWLTPAEVERTLADAWASVAPSLWAEPLGLVALEAIILGIPMIASRSGGFEETVDHGTTGLLARPGDPEDLATQMLEIASGRQFPTHRLPPHLVRAVLEERSLERHIDRLTTVLAEICGTASPESTGPALPEKPVTGY